MQSYSSALEKKRRCNLNLPALIVSSIVVAILFFCSWKSILVSTEQYKPSVSIVVALFFFCLEKIKEGHQHTNSTRSARLRTIFGVAGLLNPSRPQMVGMSPCFSNIFFAHNFCRPWCFVTGLQFNLVKKKMVRYRASQATTLIQTYFKSISIFRTFTVAVACVSNEPL